jgi:hypothetical protein
MSRERDGLARSLQARLARHAKELGVDPNLLLTRYAIERFLYRLSRSPYAERFVLKGALLMLVWLGETLRPTRDADLLGFGELSDETLVTMFAEICDIQVDPDAVRFLAETVRVEPIRMEDAYGGRRILLGATMGKATLRVQVDVGIGDATVPEPGWLDYPSLLDLPRPHMRAYAVETVVAEKLHAMVTLGSRNSRMKDYFDVHALARHGLPDADQLTQSIAATFERRKTLVPGEIPIGLTDEFALDPLKLSQWKAFLDKNGLNAPPLTEVVAEIRRLVAFSLASACERREKS